jgi:hypothetical protein
LTRKKNKKIPWLKRISRPEKISGITEDALETLAEALYPDILEFFNSEEGQKEFAEWKASQQNKT